MGYLTVLHVSLCAKIGDLHAKDSSLFRERLIKQFDENGLLCNWTILVHSASEPLWLNADITAT